TGQIRVRVDPAVIAAAAEKLAADRWASAAQRKAVETIAHAGLPLAEGILHERATVLDLLQGPERQALAHAHMAERMTRHIPEATAAPRPIAAAAVIGDNENAIGFAAAFLHAGLAVTTLCDLEDRKAGLRAAILLRATELGQASVTPRAESLSLASRFAVTTDLAALHAADLVVIASEHAVSTTIACLDPVVRPGVVIGVVTAGDAFAALSDAGNRSQDIVGLHAVQPPGPSRLLEVQLADITAPEAVATVFALAARMRMVAVRNLGRPVGMRIHAHCHRFAQQMLLAGVPPSRLDRLIADAGLGPRRFADAVPAAPNRPRALDAAPALADDAIVARYFAAMTLEACRALDQGASLRATDIDATLLGYGLRRTLGGLFHMADRMGLPGLIAQIDSWSAEAPDFWHLPDRLRQLARRKGHFADLNKEQMRES
ncbi:MAG: 3-hydroxyacyl-CoA dehydrogenase NAD-binding domain-containing protein, partial [Gemmobacter sp.]|nr:3-hydroxyacyl-CoA dehydrogenase NAD-binding domain-containing protein [Gemmobacter sp.]